VVRLSLSSQAAGFPPSSATTDDASNCVYCADLPPALREHSSIRTEEALAGLTSFRALNIIVTVLSVLALIVFWVALYRPLIRRLDQDIKDVRRLLLLLPDEVSRSIPSVVAAGRSMLLDSGIAAATTTVTAQNNVTVDANATEDGTGLPRGRRAGASVTPSDNNDRRSRTTSV